MLALWSQSPRRFKARKLPAYPSLAAVGTLVLATACQRGPLPSEGPDAHAPRLEPTASASPSGEPIFPEDNQALNLDIGCRGDCPSPFQMASAEKDQAQVRARVRHCVRSTTAAPAVHGNLTIRGAVHRDGHVTDLELPEDILPGPLAACIKDLVLKGKFTPPEEGESRVLYASFYPGPK